MLLALYFHENAHQSRITSLLRALLIFFKFDNGLNVLLNFLFDNGLKRKVFLKRGGPLPQKHFHESIITIMIFGSGNNSVVRVPDS